MATRRDWRRTAAAALAAITVIGAAIACGSSGSNTFTCNPGQTQCAGVCADLTKDSSNCGACGNACAAGQSCTGGACTLACNGGTKLCGAACADTNVDPKNCGACGNGCAGGQVCAMGMCASSCPMTLMTCGSSCVDAMSDPQNCGGCGKACMSGYACVSGTCSLACQDGLTMCRGTNGAYCANTQTDNANCGACGKACGAGQACVKGACTETCGPPNILCGGDGGAPFCVNPQSDDQNCGGCGVVCPAGTTCSDATCAVTCGPTTTLCYPPDGGATDAGRGDGGDGGAPAGPYCANTQTDNANCGGCGVVCGPGTACSGGMCNITCLPPTQKCGMSCVDTTKDNNNCGTCGNVCVDGGCVNSQCLDSVALVISDSADPTWPPILVTAIQNTNAFYSVDFVDASGTPAPSVATLQKYAAILVASNTAFGDRNGLGNNVATYFDGGGRVVLVQGSSITAGPDFSLGGRFGDPTQGYLLITPTPNYTFNAAALGAVADPSSPLMNGVTALAANTALRTTAGTTPGAITVASWNDGQPLIVRGVAHGRNRADLNLFYAPATAWQGSGWTGNGAEMMRNALLYK